MQNFWALKISRKENKFGCTLIAELRGQDARALSGIFRLFRIAKSPYLNQATPQKNTCQILLPSFLRSSLSLGI